MKHTARKTAIMGICVALAMIFSYVEALLPPIFAAVPGVKLGLANVVVIFMLYRCGAWRAAAVSLIRVLLMALLFGNAFSFAYSFCGALGSLAVMVLLKKARLFTVVGVSVVGAIAHNVAQILVAIALLGVSEIGYYLIVLAVTGCVFGVAIGLLAAVATRRVPALPLEGGAP